MVLNGPKNKQKGYIEGLNMLASMRFMCQRADATRDPKRHWVAIKVSVNLFYLEAVYTSNATAHGSLSIKSQGFLR